MTKVSLSYVPIHYFCHSKESFKNSETTIFKRLNYEHFAY